MSELFTNGYAVIVGVGADLPVTIDDATAIANQLKDPDRCAYPNNQVHLLTGENARRQNILAALDWLGEVTKPHDTSIVYFSGHGIETPDFHLLPYGYDLNHLATTAIMGSEFTDKLRSIQAGKLVVLLDCCHAGGQAEPKGFHRSPLPAGAFSEFSSGSGRVVIASSRADEISWTGKPYSVFTTAILEGLAGYGAFEQDGYARILDVAIWASRVVPQRTRNKQNPIIKISNLEINFALAWYAGGEKKPKDLTGDWKIVSDCHDYDDPQRRTWCRMLKNHRRNLLYIEERMSEYTSSRDIPLDLKKDRDEKMQLIAELEQKLGLRSPE